MNPINLTMFTISFCVILPLVVRAAQQVYHKKDFGPIKTSLVVGILGGLPGWMFWLGLTKTPFLKAFSIIPSFFMLVAILVASIFYVGAFEILANLVLDALLPGIFTFILALIMVFGGVKVGPQALVEGGYKSFILICLIFTLAGRVIFWKIKAGG